MFAFLGIFASWVDQQVFDTNEWTDRSSQLLEDKEIRGALSVYLVDQLYKNVDVEAKLRSVLPPDTRALAGPAAGALRELAPRAANRALESAPVQDAWAAANRAAHKQLLDVIENCGNAVSTGGGNVTPVFLLLVIWAPARAFTRAGPLIIIVFLMLIGTEALRRQTRREHPDAAMPEGGIREAIGGLRSGPTRADHDEPGRP